LIPVQNICLEVSLGGLPQSNMQRASGTNRFFQNLYAVNQQASKGQVDLG
jgi:hypothetical protein